jgi:hypothetical protein
MAQLLLLSCMPSETLLCTILQMKVRQMSDTSNDGDQISFLWSYWWIDIQWVDGIEGASSVQQAQCKISAQEQHLSYPSKKLFKLHHGVKNDEVMFFHTSSQELTCNIQLSHRFIYYYLKSWIMSSCSTHMTVEHCFLATSMTKKHQPHHKKHWGWIPNQLWVEFTYVWPS